jgi:sulfatase modifying factor 1
MSRRVAEIVGAMIAAVLVLGAAAPRGNMVRIPAGMSRGLYAESSVPVASFLIDRDPVTRDEYLSWKAGRAVRSAEGRRPMTEVTRAEAAGYCAAREGRLPSLAEWELVAAASRNDRDASLDPAFAQSLVSDYTSRDGTRTVDHAAVNAYGVRGLHDLVWEWAIDPHAQHHMEGAGHELNCAGAALGASDPRNYPAFLRAAFRSGLTDSTRLPTLGFRCAAP